MKKEFIITGNDLLGGGIKPTTNKMEKGFHWQDGLYFKRNEDHSVTITQMKSNNADETEVAFTTNIPENGWASIIASVSAKGEAEGRYYKALEWHNQ